MLGWLETNKKRVGTIALAAAVVATAVGLWAWRNSQQEAEAEVALSAMKLSSSPNEPATSEVAEQLARIANEYPKTTAGAKALLRSATAYFDAGNFPKAGEQFDRFLRTYAESSYVPQAVFGVAASLDAQGKGAEAIAKYNDFLKSYGSDPASERARLALARLYEQNNQASQAFEILSKSANPQAGQMASPEVQQRLSELLTKHPSLMPPTPAPTITPQPNILTNFTRQTNAVRITPVTNAAAATGGAPKIILNPAPATPGK